MLQNPATVLEEVEKLPKNEHFKKVKDAAKNFTRIVMTRVLPIYMAYYGGVNALEQKDGPFKEKERARHELATDGITHEQKSTYKMGLSEVIRRGITPLSYTEDDPYAYLRMIPNLITGREKGRIVQDQQGKNVDVNEFLKSSEDAWNMYLGLAQKNKTFDISDYKPAQSHEDKYYYKVSKFEGAFKRFLAHSEFYGSKENTDYKPGLLKYVKQLEDRGNSKVVSSEIGGTNHDSADYEALDIALMFGHYTVTKGHDEKGSYISYYDKWDLNALTETNAATSVGKPFEIYDRIYYNPETGEIIENLPSTNQ
jgi:hypothetical protein